MFRRVRRLFCKHMGAVPVRHYLQDGNMEGSFIMKHVWRCPTCGKEIDMPKITDLAEIAAAGMNNNDVIPVVDVSEGTSGSKKFFVYTNQNMHPGIYIHTYSGSYDMGWKHINTDSSV